MSLRAERRFHHCKELSIAFTVQRGNSKLLFCSLTKLRLHTLIQTEKGWLQQQTMIKRPLKSSVNGYVHTRLLQKHYILCLSSDNADAISMLLVCSGDGEVEGIAAHIILTYSQAARGLGVKTFGLVLRADKGPMPELLV